MQPQQQERLKRMINNSSMLTPQEKEEWLSMLIVMNDKQVSELEAILSSPTEQPASTVPAPLPTAATPQASAPASKPAQPLSHISNLPPALSQVAKETAPRAVPKTPAPVLYPLPKPVLHSKPPAVKSNRDLEQWQKRLRRAVEEKELPKPEEEKLISSHSAPPAPKLAPAMRPVVPGLQTPAAPQPSPQPSPSPVVASRPPSPPMKTEEEVAVSLASAKDAAKLTVGNMRAMGANLASILKQVVAGSNYFEVLFYLEKSPLYQAYLDTGHEALNAGPGPFPVQAGGKTLLTKAEFETFSDLLKSIQIS